MKNLFSNIAAVPASVAFILMLLACFIGNIPTMNVIIAILCAIASGLYLIAFRNNDEVTNPKWLDFGDKQYLILSLIWFFNTGMWLCII